MPRTIAIERLSLPLALTATAGEKRPGESARFRGIASVWNSVIDTTGTVGYRSRFRKGAFAKTLSDWRSSSPSRQRIKLLDSHRQDAPPIGLPLELEESDRGLELYGSLNETALGRDWAAVLAHARAVGQADACELSIGFDPINSDLVEDEEDGEMLREVGEARLWECSLVSAGADRQTVAVEAASLADMLSGPDYEKYRQHQLAEIERFEKELAAVKPWSCIQ